MAEQEPQELSQVKQAVQGKLQQIDSMNSEMFSGMSPQGKFSKAALNGFVKAHNKVLKLFEPGLTYPVFTEDIQVFPEEFTRQVSMIMQAVQDAIAQEVLPAEMSFSLEDIVDDRSLKLLAGKFEMLSKSKDFKGFLHEREEAPQEEVQEHQTGEEAKTPSDQEMDDLFLSRM